MANMTFKASLLPNTDLGYSLGSSDKRWKLYGNLAGLEQTTRFSKNSDNEKIEDVTGWITDTKSFIHIRGFADPSVYRTSHDMPAPYGLGFGNGSESAGIMPVGAGDKLQELRFYGANSGPTLFTFGRQNWESNTYDSATSNRYTTYASINSTNGNIITSGTITATGNITAPRFIGTADSLTTSRTIWG